MLKYTHSKQHLLKKAGVPYIPSVFPPCFERRVVFAYYTYNSDGIRTQKRVFGAFASAWSPSISITVFGITIGGSAEVGAVGGSFDASLGASIGSVNVSGSYGGVGLSGFISWDLN